MLSRESSAVEAIMRLEIFTRASYSTNSSAS